MIIDDNNTKEILKCVGGGGLNGECISDTFFIINFFVTFGLMIFLITVIPVMLGVFIYISVRFCKNDKKRNRLSKAFEMSNQTPLLKDRDDNNIL